MADADRIAAALRYQQDQAMPSPLAAAIQSPEYIGGALRDPQFYGDIGRRLSGLLKGGLQDILPTGAGPIMAKQGYEADPNYMQKMNDVGLAGMTVFHGSPYKFDKFDMGKIGTGEGAQAYGHGLYLAENPATARTYSADRAYVGAAMQGKPLAINYDDPAWIAQKTIEELGDPAKATAHLQMVQRTAGKYQPPETKAAVQGALDLIASGGVAPKGNLYKVDLPDEHIAKMLDWDKPLSQQGEIKNIARKLGYFNAPKLTQEQVALMVKETGNANPAWKYAVGGHPAAPSPEQAISNAARLFEETPATWSGQRAVQGEGAKFYDFLENKLGTQEKVSKILRDNGIPGIRYLDQGSRGAGQGTSNFVVFDPAHMNIIGRE